MGVQAKLISGIHDSIHQQDAAVAVVQGAALFTMMIYPPVNIEMWKTRHEWEHPLIFRETAGEPLHPTSMLAYPRVYIYPLFLLFVGRIWKKILVNTSFFGRQILPW